MVWCSGWRLASAVSNSGGLGVIGSGSMSPDVLREHIQKCRAHTNNNFANITGDVFICCHQPVVVQNISRLENFFKKKYPYLWNKYLTRYVVKNRDL